ncbi:MAG: TonB family protein [Oceanicaulis sp.]
MKMNAVLTSLAAGSAVLALITAPASAQADLPADVVGAYRAYEAAADAEDVSAAADAATWAWRAAERGGVDASTLAILADNAGQYLYADGRYEESLEAFERSGDLLEDVGGEPIEIAQTWRLAAEAAYRAQDDRKAEALADRAGDLVESLPQTPAHDFELSRARGVQSLAGWRRGSWRQAGRRGAEAFEAYQRAGGELSSDHALYAFYAGIEQTVERETTEAAWWLSVADYLFDQLDVPSDTGRAIRAWSEYGRGELSESERIALMQRLSREGFMDEPCIDDCVEEAEPDWVAAFPGDAVIIDAAPIRRQAPTYPIDAAYAGLDGLALVRFDIDTDGRPQNIETVLSVPHAIFGEAAASAVRAWRYEPATVNGELVVRERVATYFIFEMED